jgi:hypothetical protein
MQARLVPLQSQVVVATLVNDLLGDLTLAVQRIDGHDGAFERQHLQQLRHRSDFVGLRVSGDLCQHQALLGRLCIWQALGCKS